MSGMHDLRAQRQNLEHLIEAQQRQLVATTRTSPTICAISGACRMSLAT